MKNKCQFKNCDNNAESMRRNKYKVYYHKWCTTHKRKRYGMPLWEKKPGRDRVRKLKKGICTKCKWKGEPTHIHRIVPGSKGGKYTEDNVMELCPNCHIDIHKSHVKSNPIYLKTLVET